MSSRGQKNGLHTSALSVQKPHQWLLLFCRRGMSASGNEYGPLVDIPDWSYADGRPAPLGRREIARRERRRDCAMRVVELIDEMKFAKKNYARKQKLQEEEKNRLISRKLKSRTS